MQKVLFIGYDGCSTCKKAKKWLSENGVEFEDRAIKENPPTKDELNVWIEKSGLTTKKWFNTSGLKYRELGLKDKLAIMSFDEMTELLSSDGMLVKRPIVVSSDKVMIGFKEKEWEEYFKN